jgi:glutaredoxin
MDIKIYTSSTCGWCLKIKELLKRAEVEYTEYRLGVDFTREEFSEMFKDRNSFPTMTVDGEYIGGLTESVRYFVEKGLVSSSKK